MVDNKNSFFCLILPTYRNTEAYQEKLDNATDLIFSSMGVRNTIYKFIQKNNSEIVYLFKTDNRKRKGQLSRFCERYLPENQEYCVKGLTKFLFDTELERIKKNTNFLKSQEPLIFEDYKGSDIKIFENKTNWHPWQKDVYDMIFHQDGTYKEPDPRNIISLIDKKGNSGKSSFFKWLSYKNPESIGRLGYGSASQLRSSAVNIGKKELYIVDLARSKSKQDREEDLLSVLEDLKSGFITNAMYGSGKILMMEPPHIIVSSNYEFKYEALSSDRWHIYRITSKKKLKKLSLAKKSVKEYKNSKNVF